jgi:hypothetical protein
MSIDQYLDQFSLVTLLITTILVFIVSIEVGFRLGTAHRPNAMKAQTSQVRAVMGATLGLLAFMLAFIFSSAQTHYETRVQNMVEEARIAGTAFLQADFLQEPAKTQAKTILYQYTGDRLKFQNLIRQGQVPEAMALIGKAEIMQRELWQVSVGIEFTDHNAVDPKAQSDPFMRAIVELIDIHNLRLQAALMNRIPAIIWLILLLTAFLSMLVMGYQAGLTGRRSPVATYSLAIAFSAVIILITDLDRPRMSMFEINNQIMINLNEKMAGELGHPVD